MSDSKSDSGCGIFVAILQAALIILKIVRFEGNPVSEWSWWVVLLPFEVCMLIGVGVLIALLIILAVKRRHEKPKWE